jgi:hypothetical protein
MEPNITLKFLSCSGEQPLLVPAQGYGLQPSLRGLPQPEGGGFRQDVQAVRYHCLGENWRVF